MEKNARSREEEDYFLSENILKILVEKEGTKPELVGKIFDGDSIEELEDKNTYNYLFD